MKKTIVAVAIAAVLPWSAASRADIDTDIDALRAEFDQKFTALQADYEARLKALENRLETAEIKPAHAQQEAAANPSPAADDTLVIEIVRSLESGAAKPASVARGMAGGVSAG